MKAIPQIIDCSKKKLFSPQTRRELYAQCFDELIRQVSPHHNQSFKHFVPILSDSVKTK